MASTLNPYLNFVDNTREAMEHYRDVFGGELSVSTFGEYGAPDGIPGDAVMHSTLVTSAGFTLMASDIPPGIGMPAAPHGAISLSGDDADELRGYWEKLSADGTVSTPLEKQMWGDEFGQCVDRFGVGWLVNIAAPQA